MYFASICFQTFTVYLELIESNKLNNLNTNRIKYIIIPLNFMENDAAMELGILNKGP